MIFSFQWTLEWMCANSQGWTNEEMIRKTIFINIYVFHTIVRYSMEFIQELATGSNGFQFYCRMSYIFCTANWIVSLKKIAYQNDYCKSEKQVKNKLTSFTLL